MVSFKVYIIGGLIYVILAIALGMLGTIISGAQIITPFALLISALIAGIYVGTKATTPAKGAIDGIIAGIIGGIIAGIVAKFIPVTVPGSTGVSFLDQIVSSIGITLEGYVPLLAGFGFFIVAGIILGAIGGFIGKKIKK